MREGPHGARQLAPRDDGARALDPFDVPIELGMPERYLQTKGHRLGMDAVRPADHRCAAMLVGPQAHGGAQPVEPLEDQIAGLTHLQRLRGVDDVRRRHAEVQPARRWTDVLLHRRREGDDVVLRLALDFLDARDVEGCLLADVTCRFRRHDTLTRHRLHGGNLDLQPGFVTPLVAPDATHLRVRVAWDHAADSRVRPASRCRPGAACGATTDTTVAPVCASVTNSSVNSQAT